MLIEWTDVKSFTQSGLSCFNPATTNGALDGFLTGFNCWMSIFRLGAISWQGYYCQSIIRCVAKHYPRESLRLSREQQCRAYKKQFVRRLKSVSPLSVTIAGEQKHMKVLVTGVAGFIGSHVADELITAGCEVFGIDDLSGGFERNVPAGVKFQRLSILEQQAIDALFQQQKFDAVFHLAAYAAEGLSHFIRNYNYSVNLVGSVNLLNAAINHGVGTFVFTSSIAVYGAGQLPLREDVEPQPEDPYGISKYAFELDLRAAHEMFGIDYIIFRPHNVYGEKQNIADPYRNVVGIFMNQSLKGQSYTVFGDGEQTRAFSHIKDVAPIIANSINVPAARNTAFNIGADIPYSVNQLAKVVSNAMGVPLRINHLPARKEVIHAYSSHDKVKKTFGHEPKVTLEEGITRMAKWVKEIGPGEPVVFENIEVERNLPPSWKVIAPTTIVVTPPTVPITVG
jgi:UDP-glucose 4-epimerase